MKKDPVILYTSDRNRIADIMKYIELNLKNDLSVSNLAREFGSSENTLRRHFKYLSNKSLREYILQCRMKEAHKLVASKEFSINIIAHEVGYKNRTSFTHAFTKYYGVPPFDVLIANMNVRELVENST